MKKKYFFKANFIIYIISLLKISENKSYFIILMKGSRRIVFCYVWL